MKKTILIVLPLLLAILSTGCFKGEGKVRVAADKEDMLLYVDGNKKATVSTVYTDMLITEGEHEFTVVKKIDDEWVYKGSKKVFVGADTSTKINLKSKKEPSQKRVERLVKLAKLAEAKNQKLLSSKKAIKYKGLIYGQTKSPYTGKIWLDRNIGAKRVCISLDDKDCYGDYFQWGRDADGHEKQNSKKTSNISSSSQPNHSKFITSNYNSKYNWMESKNSNLWQGKNAKNNPCPKGFRVPTIDELLVETIKHGLTNSQKLYESFLRLPVAGNRKDTDGSLRYQNVDGYVWSSSKNGNYPYNLGFDGKYVNKYSNYSTAYGFSIRCLKD